MSIDPLDLFRTSTPVCPHCGHEMTTDDMISAEDADLFNIAPNEGEADIECPSCSQTFHVEGGYQPHYTTSIPDDWDDEEEAS